jgi:hypothetical protein
MMLRIRLKDASLVADLHVDLAARRTTSYPRHVFVADHRTR